MMNSKCFTCGILVSSATQYHFHNVTHHNIEELSSTVVKFLFQDEQNYLKQNIEPRKTSTSGGIFQECMDEVIELGTIEGDDNLTVQSLFLKSNFTPNSRHIIEVQEKKQPKDVIKALSEEFNATVVRFQKDCLITELSQCESRLHRKSERIIETVPKKRFKRRIKNIVPGKRRETKRDVNETNPQGSNENPLTSIDKKSNVKIVLRSGRTIKTNPKYEDYVYYDDFKENSLKTYSVNSVDQSVGKEVQGLNKDVKCSSSISTLSRNQSKREYCSVDLFSTRLLDLFPDDFNIDDLNLSGELDIKVEDLDLPGFDDLEGTLPENQILTIENLLQELDGGGSIEISNIIKENNIESDTVVLDALLQNVNKDLIPFNEGIVNSQNEKRPHVNWKKVKKCSVVKNFCKLCNKSYSRKINYQNHISKYHSGTESNKMLYKCTTCDSVFAFLAAFERHMKNHNPQQTFLCEICGRNFKNLINLKLHTALHNKTVTYQCHLCPCKYYLKYSYFNHLKTHGKQNKFYCQKCDKTFSQKHHFNKHLENHVRGKYLCMSSDLKCNYCNDIKPLSDISEGNFENCTKCKKGIYKKYLIKNKDYIGSENAESQERRECKICGKQVKNFKKHIRETHLSNPVVQCDICDQSVKKTCLNAHKFRRHKGIETKCDHCNKMFKNALALKDHLNKVKKQIS